MIEKIIEKIQYAEKQAEDIKKAAHDCARQMENDNQIAIEKLKEAALEDLKKNIKLWELSVKEQTGIDNEKYAARHKQNVDLNDAKKLDDAKAFIISEFYKRLEL